MSTKDEALKLALAWVADTAKYMPTTYDRKGIALYAILKEALAEQPTISAGPITPAMMMLLTTEQKRALLAMNKAEQPAQQQEPVAWIDGYRNIYSLEEKAAGCEDAVIPLVPATLQHWSDCAVHNEPAYQAGKCDCGGYTSPPASKPWVGLTDEEITVIASTPCAVVGSYVHTFARAIEAKLKDKNA